MKLNNGNTIIFDPFMGVGGCAIAAYELNRKFLGCELDKQYFDIAVNRVKEVENIVE